MGGGEGGLPFELQPISAWQLVSEQMQALGEHFEGKSEYYSISILIQKRRIQYVSL
jgi:hypothetical protein